MISIMTAYFTDVKDFFFAGAVRPNPGWVCKPLVYLGERTGFATNRRAVSSKRSALLTDSS
jgi:hypothetical protein